MRDLAVRHQTECERVYTTAPGCVAAETRPPKGLQIYSHLQPIWLARELHLLSVKGGSLERSACATQRRLPL